MSAPETNFPATVASGKALTYVSMYCYAGQVVMLLYTYLLLSGYVGLRGGRIRV